VTASRSAAAPPRPAPDSILAVERLDPSLVQAITELDVNASTENRGADVSNGTLDPYTRAVEDDEDAGAKVGHYYRDLFTMVRRQAPSLDSVTFWGISNARSWLRTWPTARPWEQPLPFDDDLQAAPAYWGIVDPMRLPARPADVLPPRIADVSTLQAVSPGRRGVRLAYALPSTIDTRDGVVPVSCSPAPAHRFRVGTTTVTCTAEDEAGNTRTSTFDVWSPASRLTAADDRSPMHGGAPAHMVSGGSAVVTPVRPGCPRRRRRAPPVLGDGRAGIHMTRVRARAADCGRRRPSVTTGRGGDGACR
jgi:hypothetical protein